MDRRRHGQLVHYFEPQRSSTQKARCLHQPQAARLLLFAGEAASRYFSLERDMVSPQTPLAETASRFERRFWDTVSATGLSQKLHPTLDVHYGTQFPEGRFSHAILIKTKLYSSPKITSSHAGASASGSTTAHRHAICCTVKSASGTLILYLAYRVKEGRISCQDGKHRSRSCSPCSRLHLP